MLANLASFVPSCGRSEHEGYAVTHKKNDSRRRDRASATAHAFS
jgi:hypothetical protein